MDKKKIGIITVFIAVFMIIGATFNTMFAKGKEESKQPVVKTESTENDDRFTIYLDSEDKNEDPAKEDETSTEEGNEEVAKETETNTGNENNVASKNDTSDKNNEAITSNTSSSTNNSNTQENTKPQETITPEPPKKDTVTIAISCKTAINNGVNNQSGFSHLPSNGVILSTQTVEIENGDTVFDVLQKVVRANGIHMEYTGAGSTLYVEGIHNLYEFDGGQNSGWMYNVNGWYPNYGAGTYELKANDTIQWNYTCDLGADLGANQR